MSIDPWTLNGGDIRASVEVMARARQPGALLSIEMEWHSLQRARAAGLERAAEAAHLRGAWEMTVAALPPAAIGRRVMWTRFDFVLSGTQSTLSRLGQRLVAVLKGMAGSVEWHLVFTEVFLGESERTLCCDPGYDLLTVKGRTAIAWAKPYSGEDWQLSQRYPTVTFVPVDGEPNADVVGA
jgi:hypothetical protein